MVQLSRLLFSRRSCRHCKSVGNSVTKIPIQGQSYDILCVVIWLCARQVCLCKRSGYGFNRCSTSCDKGESSPVFFLRMNLTWGEMYIRAVLMLKSVIFKNQGVKSLSSKKKIKQAFSLSLHTSASFFLLVKVPHHTTHDAYCCVTWGKTSSRGPERLLLMRKVASTTECN